MPSRHAAQVNTPSPPPKTHNSQSHLETSAVLDITLGALRTAVDMIGTAHSISLRAAGVPSGLNLAAGGRGGAAGLAVRTEGDGGARGGQGDGGSSGPPPREQAQGLQV